MWLSFLGHEGGLGVCLIELDDDEIAEAKECLAVKHPHAEPGAELAAAAMTKAHLMECNPGGDVLTFDLTMHMKHYDHYPRYRVLSAWELNKLAEQG
jgi:hypothetical protein